MKHHPSRLQRAIACAMAAALALPPAALAQAGRKPGEGSSRAAASGSGSRVTLNFVNADVEAVTRAFAAMIDRQIVVDPRVRGTMTVYSEQPLTVREAYQNYLSALRGLGFAMIETGGLLKVVPEADARLQTGTVQIDGAPARTGQVLTQIFRLQHENPNSLVPILRPLITANNTINVNPGTSSLVITDYAENLERLGKIIAALDQPSSTDFEIVPLEHAIAADVAVLVQRLATTSVIPVPGAQVAAGATSVIADSRSNSLIVRAPNQAQLRSLRAAIARLDRPTAGGGPGGNIWVVHLKNADAAKLATVLRAAFSGQPTAAQAQTQPTTRLPTPVATAATPVAGGATAATAPIAASPEPSTGGFVQADPATNSLIITAPEPLYRQIRAMIDQLDTRRAQIYIESLIVEVSGDNLADFGFQWQGLSGADGDTNRLVGGTNLPSGTNVPGIIAITQAAVAGQIGVGAGLNIGLVRNFSGTYALAAIAQFLQTQSNVNIMSTPNLITLDNEEAKIVVGRNVPFITGQFTNTGTGTTNPFQTIERRDVGLTLRIKPQIGEGGTVRMAIFQESSDVLAQAQGTAGAGPTTSKRSIESNVTVDDGQILVLGGLIEDRYEDSTSKVPVLGDLPYVGGLFRSESRTRKRSNLMVFLRPVVLRDAASTERLSLDRYDLIRGAQKNAQPKPSVVVPVNEAPVIPPMRPEPPPQLTPAQKGFYPIREP